MQVTTHKTRRIVPGDSLLELIDAHLPPVAEQTIVVVTSKIISLCEGSVVSKDAVESKEALIRQSADAYLEFSPEDCVHPGLQITLKNNLLIPSAGIDESNGNGVYILYPEDIQASALSIWNHIRQRDGIEKLGVLITDSHTTPMRRGVVGIALGWCGFEPLYNYIGKPDCFGSFLKVTQVNNLDALAVAAVFCMGEGNEQTPLATITNAPKIAFQTAPPTHEDLQNIFIPMEEDLYAPLLKNARWVFRSLQVSI